jgi:hypothetical protein
MRMPDFSHMTSQQMEYDGEPLRGFIEWDGGVRYTIRHVIDPENPSKVVNR